MAESDVCHSWGRIQDLSSDTDRLARPDLDQLLQRWQQERESLQDSTKVERLQERLATLWAIEAGIIERLYTVDRGTTATLVELGLGAIERFSTTGRITREAVNLIEDQRAALDFVFEYLKDERPLTTSYIKELHQLLLRSQRTTEAVDQFGTRFQTDILRGEWKKWPNNPLTPEGKIHEYCPPDFVEDEMQSLLTMHLHHDVQQVRPEVEAAWLHHRFAQIHPFQDGNGRVARALSTMVFLKAGFLPLVIRDEEHREKYLDALGLADDGDLSPLVTLFANIQAHDLDEAITFVREMRGEGIRQIAQRAADAVKRRVIQDEDTVERLADHFLDLAQARLREVAFELHEAFVDEGLTLDTFVGVNDDEREGWWTRQVIGAAQNYRYRADLTRHRRWAQMRLMTDGGGVSRWHIVVSFHHKESRAAIMSAVVFLTTSESDAEQGRLVVFGSPAEFTFSSGSKVSDADFKDWLEAALTRLLEDWQSRI